MSCTDNKLEFLPPLLYIYVGMHVLISHNIAVKFGVGNGTLGVVAGFIWENEDAQNGVHINVHADNDEIFFIQPNSAPKYILVRLLGEKSIELKKAILFPGLSDDVFPIEALEKTVETKTPQGVKVHAKMMQFPMNCADAITIHKLQGTTITGNLYIHTLVKAGYQGAYTALTRCRNHLQLFLLEKLHHNMVSQWTQPRGLEKEMKQLSEISNRLLEIEKLRLSLSNNI